MNVFRDSFKSQDAELFGAVFCTFEQCAAKPAENKAARWDMRVRVRYLLSKDGLAFWECFVSCRFRHFKETTSNDT